MKFIFFSIVLILGLGFFGAGDALAQLHYEPIVEIPRLDPNTQSTEQYVNALYLLAITIAALLAVVKIIFGGVKWMLSDVITDKSAAKKDIRGALLGLLIVLSAVIILETINTDLTNLNILGNADGLNISAPEALAPEPTACEADADSADCCTSQGGTHFQEVVGGVITNRCNLGEVVPLEETGDDEQDRVNCVTGGLEWDDVTKECRTPAILEMPLPPNSEGLHPNVACGNYGLYWEYREETNTCINRS